jgi:hypothetical protein
MVQQTVADMFDGGDDDDDDDNNDLEDTPACPDARHLTRALQPAPQPAPRHAVEMVSWRESESITHRRDAAARLAARGTHPLPEVPAP